MDQYEIIKGSHFKKIVGHGSLYFIASIITKALHAVLLPIYTHWLEPTEYAVYSNLFAISALVVIFTSLYMDNAYGRFFFEAQNNTKVLRRMFSTIFLFMLGWSLVVITVIFFIIRNPIVQTFKVPVVPYVLLVCAIPVLWQFNILASAHYRAQHKSMYVTGAKYLWFVTCATVALVLLLGFRLKAQALLWGILAGEIASLVFYYTRLWNEELVGADFSPRFLKEALVYSLGLLPLTAASWLSTYSDRLLITWFGGMAASGIYSVAFQIGRLINMLVLSVFMVYGPMIFAMLKEDAKKNVPRIEQFQSFYFHAIIGMAFIISIFSPELFQLLVDEKYHSGISLVPVIAFAFALGGIRKLYATLIYYHKMTLLISLGGILQALLNFGLNILLIPHFAGKAAAWSKLFSMLFVAVYFWLLSRKYEPLRIDWRAMRATLFILLVCLGVLGLCVYVLSLGFWTLLAAKIGIILLAFGLTWKSRFGDELRRVLSKRKDQKDFAGEELQHPYESISETDEG